MAPEIYTKKGSQSKADVWSLFVTMVFILNPEFRSKSWKDQEEVFEAIEKIANQNFNQLKSMVVTDPTGRSSAADMLRVLFHTAPTETAEDDLNPGASASEIHRILSKEPPTHIRNIHKAFRPSPKNQAPTIEMLEINSRVPQMHIDKGKEDAGNKRMKRASAAAMPEEGENQALVQSEQPARPRQAPSRAAKRGHKKKQSCLRCVLEESGDLRQRCPHR